MVSLSLTSQSASTQCRQVDGRIFGRSLGWMVGRMVNNGNSSKPLLAIIMIIKYHPYLFFITIINFMVLIHYLFSHIFFVFFVAFPAMLVSLILFFSCFLSFLCLSSFLFFLRFFLF